MVRAEDIKIFRDFFKGRTDDFAEQQQDGDYFRIGKPLEDLHIEQHLEGSKSYGMYQVIPESNLCWHTVLDIDVLDQEIIIKVVESILKIGIKDNQILLELSGNKGYHIWLTFNKAIEAWKAQRLGQVIASLSKVVIEVFPKQSSVPKDKFGNLVKLPLGIHKKSGNRSCFLDKDFKEIDWQTCLLVSRDIDIKKVDSILNDFKQEKTPKAAPVIYKGSEKGILPPCVSNIFNTEIPEGSRDNLLFRLAVIHKKNNYSKEETLIRLIKFNKEKCKPALSSTEVVKKVDSAYSGPYTSFGCEEPYMQRFCKDDCPLKSNIIIREIEKPTSDTIDLDSDYQKAEEVREKFKKWLYFKNYDVIDVVMATCIINRNPIDPVWLFLVDPPSSGKTEILRAFTDPKHILTVSSLTPKSLISGRVNAKTHNTVKDPSLFAKINNKIFIVKDFTTVLSMHPRDQAEIFSLMRDSYDGYVEKKFGETVNVYRYETHYGFLGGVTLAIDMAYTLNQTMGERFLKFRIGTDRNKAQERARQNRSRVKEMRAELNAVSNSFLESFQVLPEVKWDEKREKIVDIASNLVSLIRTPVIRNWKTFDVIEVAPEAEMPMRLANSLKNLADGLAIVRGKQEITDEEIKTVIKVAFDNLPVKLYRIVWSLYPLIDYCVHSEIAENVKLNTATVTRTIDDLYALGLVAMDRSSPSTGYKSMLSEHIKKQFNEISSYMCT